MDLQLEAQASATVCHIPLYREIKVALRSKTMLSEAWIDFAAGWISGAVSVLAIQPIDTVLTRIQANTHAVVNDGTRSKPSMNTINANASASTLSLRPSSIMRSMISNFGVSSLWRGSFAMVGAVPIQNALLMSGYGAGKRFSCADDEANESSSNVLFGVFVGGCTGELP